MDDIAKNWPAAGAPPMEQRSILVPARSASTRAVERAWNDPDHGLIARILQALAAEHVHPARALVLLPYAQVLPIVRDAWTRLVPQGFAPRFESTATWLHSMGVGTCADMPDISFDVARDVLSARALLEDAGLRDMQEALAPNLTEAAHQLLRACAAVKPYERAAWAARARLMLGEQADAQLTYESVTVRIALEWALASQSPTDALFEPRALQGGLQAVLVVAGLQPDRLTEALCAHWETAGLSVHRLSAFDEPLLEAGQEPLLEAAAVPLRSLSPPPSSSPTPSQLPPGAAPPPLIRLDASARMHPARLHRAVDAEDEAERAAACVLKQLRGGVRPVALVATDRVLTRRISAVLRAHGIVIADETGWKLSTTRAAAQLMCALQACRPQASTDAVLDWLKHAPVFDAAEVQSLESALRRDGMRVWRNAAASTKNRGAVQLSAMQERSRERLSDLRSRIEAQRITLQQPRPLAAWLTALVALLQQAAQWPQLQADSAGRQLCAVLRLDAPLREAFERALSTTRWKTRFIDIAAFIDWVRTALESQSFLPDVSPGEAPDVVVLPMAQLALRPFDGAVAPGCDEQRLQSSPDPGGAWTAVQREALGLPTRAHLQATARAAWQALMRVPQVDILWRASDAGGEELQPSPLVQALVQALMRESAAQSGGAVDMAADPRAMRRIARAPTLPPLPDASALPVAQLSASAYEDLRKCPYRFFALRQLGLRETPELEAEIDKRDFGLWLHAVLRAFHERAALAPDDAASEDARRALMDRCAAAATEALGLADDEFLPFAAAWPATRDGYLRWLAAHVAQGFDFEAAETWRRQGLGRLDLVGQIDRIDHAGQPAPGIGAAPPAGVEAERGVFVIDYKTEALGKTRDRVRQPGEDTQLAFYAALLPQDTLRAAYVNIGERGETTTVEQADVVDERDRLLAGITLDVQRIAAGIPLPALGEGAVCDTCAARGICRKDFWSVSR